MLLTKLLFLHLMNITAFKYSLPLLMYAGAFYSFNHYGILIWLPVMIAFVLIPLIELALPPDFHNIAEQDEWGMKTAAVYDLLLYMAVPLQYLAVANFLYSINDPMLTTTDCIGRILVMGLLCGIFGINVGHELGHRIKKPEQWMAISLLLTSFYTHFFIEHNRGHHKYVGTPNDPSSAPYGQSIYRFWLRSITGVYRDAWRIAIKEQQKQHKHWWQNEMFQYQMLSVVYALIIVSIAGWQAFIYYAFAAITGILLLETVNYIEHYGLRRKEKASGGFERAMPHHSWNSNHIIGRLMLFELSRHSDHHYKASRKYQLLRHHHSAPQLPTGYPGSMILALLPPLWFRVMNKRIKEISELK